MRMRTRCVKCKVKLPDKQLRAIEMLYKAGVHNVVPGCENCWPEIKKECDAVKAGARSIPRSRTQEFPEAA